MCITDIRTKYSVHNKEFQSVSCRRLPFSIGWWWFLCAKWFSSRAWWRVWYWRKKKKKKQWTTISIRWSCLGVCDGVEQVDHEKPFYLFQTARTFISRCSMWSNDICSFSSWQTKFTCVIRILHAIWCVEGDYRFWMKNTFHRRIIFPSIEFLLM